MESIDHLKGICQDTRPEAQPDKLIVFMRKLSIRVTWVLLHTPLSSNQVTVISIMAGLVGGIFFCLGFDITFLIGAILFYMFEVLDCSDGEIARYRNSQSMTGNFLDLLAHYFIPLFFYAGLSFGIYSRSEASIVFLFGFMGFMGSLLMKLPSLTAWQVICVERLRESNRMNLSQQKADYRQNVPHGFTGRDGGNCRADEKYFVNKIKGLAKSVVNQVDDFYTTHYFGVVTIGNFVIPKVRINEMQIGIVEIFFVVFCSISFFNSIRLLIRFVREKKVESAYYDFFTDGKCKMDYWL